MGITKSHNFRQYPAKRLHYFPSKLYIKNQSQFQELNQTRMALQMPTILVLTDNSRRFRFRKSTCLPRKQSIATTRVNTPSAYIFHVYFQFRDHYHKSRHVLPRSCDEVFKALPEYWRLLDTLTSSWQPSVDTDVSYGTLL